MFITLAADFPKKQLRLKKWIFNEILVMFYWTDLGSKFLQRKTNKVIRKKNKRGCYDLGHNDVQYNDILLQQ
jgi:hypothetical protein